MTSRPAARRYTSLALVALTCVPLHAAEPPAAPLDAYLQGAVGAGRIPGIVAMVVDRDEVLYSGAFGRQDVAAGKAMAMDSIFRIASMTKPVTSLAVMMLVEEKRLGLDDPVSKYLPEYANKQVLERFHPLDGSYTSRPASGEITVRHLLTHTSGLGYTFSSPILSQLMGNAGPGASAARLPLLHDPGTRWTYGESTRVLGSLVEKISGQGLEQFMRARIFEPLGMRDTFYTVPAEKRARVVTVHRHTPEGLTETPNPADVTSPPNGDGGLHSTAADYARFVQLFLNGGTAPGGRRLLSERNVRLMGSNNTGNVRVELQPAANPPLSAVFPLGAGRDTFGLGFQVTAEPGMPGLRSPGSMSWAGIFNTEFWIDPRREIGGILLMQYLPFYDKAAIDTLLGFEQRSYELPKK